MSFNKISGVSLGSLPATVHIALSGGESFVLPVGQGILGTFGAITSPQIGSGNPLSGQYLVGCGQYSTVQVYDQGLQYWKNIDPVNGAVVAVSADGANYRISNSTGCPVGALVTNAGTGYTNGFYGYNAALQAVVIQNGVTTIGNTTFTVTPNAGGSLWNMIVGGAVNTTISGAGTLYQNSAFGGTGPSVTGSLGSGYSKPPVIVFTPPAVQGQQPYLLPTAVCTISGGAINTITVTNQGAGLLALPAITVVAQPGDTGGGAVLGWTAANSAQIGGGTLVVMYPAYYGTTPQTAPVTFTFSPASTTAATSIMNFTVTGFTNTTPGVGYVGAGGAITAGVVSGAAAYTNPILDKLLLTPVAPAITVAATTGVPSLAGAFQGYGFQAAPAYAAYSSGAAPGTAAVQPPTVGAANDVVWFMSM